MSFKLFAKPTLIKGIKPHGTIPAYRDQPNVVRRKGSINKRPVTFILAPEPGLSYRITFQWDGGWYFFDKNRDLYRVIENVADDSPLLDFYID